MKYVGMVGLLLALLTLSLYPPKLSDAKNLREIVPSIQEDSPGNDHEIISGQRSGIKLNCICQHESEKGYPVLPKGSNGK